MSELDKVTPQEWDAASKRYFDKLKKKIEQEKRLKTKPKIKLKRHSSNEV